MNPAKATDARVSSLLRQTWPLTAILSNVQQGIQELAIMDFDIAPLYW